MLKKEVLLVLTDRWADWEASYAIAEINSTEQYIVKTIAIDKLPKVSIGGLRAEIDYTIQEYNNFENLAMIILAGGFSWGENSYDEIANFVRTVSNLSIPVAAICGATIFLGKQGFLDKVHHTGDDLEFFLADQGYQGQTFYKSAQIVVDHGFITANETAALEFAREIFDVLKIGDESENERWYNKFKNEVTC